MERSDNILLIKLLLLLILLTVAVAGVAQNNFRYKLSGTVSSLIDKTPVPNCEVVLKASDGSASKAITNLNGEYSFELKPELLYEVSLTLYSTVTTPTARRGFLSSDEKGSFNTVGLSESQNFLKDFLLQPATCGPSFNSINFSFNDTAYYIIYPPAEAYLGYDSSEFVPGNILTNLKNVLDKNPAIVLELSGHASGNEKNAEELSQQRANKVKADLVKKGINEKRLVTKGYGKKKLRITDEELKVCSSKEEKEKLHAKNRRVVFKILNWDFMDSDTLKNKTPIYQPVITPENK